MSDLQQGWLVAVREMRERSRSRAFRASLVVMLLVVLAVIVVPSLLGSDGGRLEVGLTGAVPEELPRAIGDQGEAMGQTVDVRRYADVAAGQDAVRQGDIDVLVVDGRRLEWRRQADEQLRSILTSAMQIVAVQERATTAGISPDALLALVAPVPVENVEIGSVAGRSIDDEIAVQIMNVLLFIAISTYGNLVLTGVVEEKSSRVVEVLLARIPARSLLAGKVAGIGLLGFAQFGLTALVALVAMTIDNSVDLPAVSGGVLAWAVVWFVLGYALYAMAYGALGSLASRTEDAQSVSGPVIVVLMAGYFASFVAVGRPDSGLARLLSLFPPTAPLAMPSRIAMGAVEWWEPLLAVVLSVATIVGLLLLGGRVYASAILHTGPTLRLRDAWRSPTNSRSAAATASALRLLDTEVGANAGNEPTSTGSSAGPGLDRRSLRVPLGRRHR
jgi:ABC-2 type transport system permease protein